VIDVDVDGFVSESPEAGVTGSMVCPRVEDKESGAASRSGLSHGWFARRGSYQMMKSRYSGSESDTSSDTAKENVTASVVGEMVQCWLR